MGQTGVDPGCDLLAGDEQAVGVAEPVKGTKGRPPVLAGDLDDSLLDPAQRAQPGGVPPLAGLGEHRQGLVQSVERQGRPREGDEQTRTGRHSLLRVQVLRQHQCTPKLALGVTEPADLVEVPRSGQEPGDLVVSNLDVVPQISMAGVMTGRLCGSSSRRMTRCTSPRSTEVQVNRTASSVVVYWVQ